MNSKSIIIFALSTAIICCCTTPSIGYRINSKVYDKIINQLHEQKQQEIIERNTIVDNNNNRQRFENSIAYVKASIPIQIFQCMQQLNLLKCMKIFILQRMERTSTYENSGNLTADFLDQILASNDHHYQVNNLFDKNYMEMEESVINDRLENSFQRFFKGREIKLHFIPGMTVRVAPNAENAIKLSVKRGLYIYLKPFFI